MKNFKKVLALVLVVATLFSFVAMASAKTLEDYSDADEVKFEEAVDVLSALGIVNGYDGAFHPGDNIDRDEMAKMVAVLHYASDFDADLYAPANKFADAKGSWAEGYIAYCAQVGIIAGRNASTFDPEGKVTGVEVLKMLLCTLGYSAKEQGYVGANWQTHVLRDAELSNLLEGLADMDVYAAATRDQAAQMFLNALKADMIYGYVSENIVKLTNSIYNQWGPISYATLFPSVPTAPGVAATNGYILAYCNAIMSNVPLYNIYGRVAFESRMDCFGRPATVWTINDKNGIRVLEKAYPAAADFSFTDRVELDSELSSIVNSRNAVYSTAGATTNYDFNLYVDGALNGAVTTLAAASQENANNPTGNGVETLVYFLREDVVTSAGLLATTYELRVVCINTYVGRVISRSKLPASVTLSNGDTFANTLGLEVDDIVMYKKCAGDDRMVSGATGVIPGYHMDALDVYRASVDTGEDVHVVWKAEPVVEEIEHTFVATGTDPWVYFENAHFSSAAQKYEYSDNFGLYINPAQNRADMLASLAVQPEMNEYDIYLDEFGYVMFVERHVPEINWQYGYFVEETEYVDPVYAENGQWVNQGYMDVVNYDGMAGTKTAAAKQAIEPGADWAAVASVSAGGVITNTGANVSARGTLARYDVNEDSRIEIETVATLAPANAYITKDVARLFNVTNAAGEQIFGDKETQYMVRTYNWDTMTYSYDVYVGYNNLPATLFGNKALNYGPLPGVTNGVNVATMQYLVSNDPVDDPCVATHVFVDAMFAGTNEVFFIIDFKGEGYDLFHHPWLDGYNVYTALIDGEKALVATTAWNGTTAGSVRPSNDLYRMTVTVMGGQTYEDMPIYVDMRGVAPIVDWTVTGAPINGLLSIDDVRDALGSVHTHVEIADEAPITVVYRQRTDENTWETDLSYETFVGESRDADFNEFFDAGDYVSMDVYAEFGAPVGDPVWGEVTPITSLWLVLTENRVTPLG